MCGIAGVVSYASQSHPDPEAIRTMTDLMVHRGPDDSGFHFGPYVGLGQRRLSIIDLAGGHQPIYSDDGTKVIIFNGEIYNFMSVRAELQRLGARFSTTSDTEVLLKCFEWYGADCLQYLRGMFAFAV